MLGGWYFLVCIVSVVHYSSAHDLHIDAAARFALISNASIRFPDLEATIPDRDPFAIPANPYNISLHQTIECVFLTPDCEKMQRGGTPKFECSYLTSDNVNVTLKIKYDQQYNPVHPLWALGQPNNEVYASPVVERLLWVLGYGADLTVPVSVHCVNCPIEPWTYIRATCGLHQADWYDRWIDLELYLSGGWKKQVDVLPLNYSLAYIDWDEYVHADRVYGVNSTGSVNVTGWSWQELYADMDDPAAQQVERDAMTLFAALVSHADNNEVNQGLNCLLHNKSSINDDYIIDKSHHKKNCTGVPFLFLHDVGCTLGYGWSLINGDFWPNALDLAQWFKLSVWEDLPNCIVHVNGLADASFKSTWQISEAGRALLARLLSAMVPSQVEALFTVAQVNKFRGDSIVDWVAGWQEKVQRDILNVTCGA